ncbi:MAG: hypothetical protein KA369_06600 [Spirochaetes bacterium]|nr:hypothetical protein [Spirochaetota bacterium]
MKKTILASLILMPLMACSGGSIKVVKDDFKNLTEVTWSIDHGTDWTLNKLRINEGKYVKQIINNKATVPYYTAKLYIYQGGSTISNEIIVKTKDKTATLPLVIENTQKNLEIMIGSGFATAATSGTHKIRINFPQPLINEILKSDLVSYRFYVNEQPVTIVINKSKLEKFKSFLSITSN